MCGKMSGRRRCIVMDREVEGVISRWMEVLRELYQDGCRS